MTCWSSGQTEHSSLQSGVCGQELAVGCIHLANNEGRKFSLSHGGHTLVGLALRGVAGEVFDGGVALSTRPGAVMNSIFTLRPGNIPHRPGVDGHFTKGEVLSVYRNVPSRRTACTGPCSRPWCSPPSRAGAEDGTCSHVSVECTAAPNSTQSSGA
jgi:hypothetical protein